MAVEHSSDDLQDLAEQLSGMRVLLLEALTMLADRERRLERSRELYARVRRPDCAPRHEARREA